MKWQSPGLCRVLLLWYGVILAEKLFREFLERAVGLHVFECLVDGIGEFLMIFIFSQGEVGRVAGDDRSYGFDRKSECLGSVCDGDFILRGSIGAAGDDEVCAFGEAFVGINEFNRRVVGLVEILQLTDGLAVRRDSDLLAFQIFKALISFLSFLTAIFLAV